MIRPCSCIYQITWHVCWTNLYLFYLCVVRIEPQLLKSRQPNLLHTVDMKEELFSNSLHSCSWCFVCAFWEGGSKGRSLEIKSVFIRSSKIAFTTDPCAVIISGSRCLWSHHTGFCPDPVRWVSFLELLIAKANELSCPVNVVNQNSLCYIAYVIWNRYTRVSGLGL